MTVLTLQSHTPEVIIHGGKAVTTSMAVAEYFQKTHDNVLKKIRSVIAECEPRYHAVNFNEMVREVIVGDGAMRKSPYFELTRDAFVLIVMGFTGKRALQWKIDYINAFNRMEAELHQQEKPATAGKVNVDVLLAIRDDNMAFTRRYAPGQLMTVEEALSLLRARGWLVMPKEELAERLASF